MEERAAELRSMLQEGGLRVAAIRMLLYVSGAEGGLDERSFALIRKMRAEADNALSLEEFKDVIREQALMMTLDSTAAIQAMPHLLDGSSAAEIRAGLDAMKGVLEAAEPLSDAARESLNEMERIFEAAERRAQRREQGQKAEPSRGAEDAKLDDPVTDLVDKAAQVPGKTARPHPDAARKAVNAASAPKAAGKTAAKAARTPAKQATKPAAPATKAASNAAKSPAKRAAAARQPAKA
jgi:hypothetical protein